MIFPQVRRYQQVLQLVVSLFLLENGAHSFNIPTSSIGVKIIPQHPSLIASPQTAKTRGNGVRKSLVVQNMIPLDQVQEMLTSTMTFSDASHLLDAPSSTWLADAAATTNQNGWWQSYINIFKTTLSFVHSTIDGPLRSAGIEQTWGISIFLFTACTYCEHDLHICFCVYRIRFSYFIY